MPCHVPNTSASAVRRSSSLVPRPPTPDLTVDDAIGLYLGSLVHRGVCETSVLTLAIHARRFFAAALTQPLRSLTPQGTRQMADALTREPSAKTGRMLAASSRRNIVETARRFTAWCVDQGRLPADPMAAADVAALAALQAEILQLRGELAHVSQERDAAREQLRQAGGGR